MLFSKALKFTLMDKKAHCPLHAAMELLSNKWKPLALFHLLQGPLRSGELQKTLPEISNKMFTQTVRDLERDGLIQRAVYPEVPVRVEYALTALGRSLESILRDLDEWGKRLLPKE